MGNLVNDIVDEVNIKPNKTKQIIKIVIGVAIACIGVAFAFGQFKSSFFNRMDNLENKVDKQTIAVERLKTDMNAGFNAVDEKFDKVYEDGLVIFNDFQEYNDKQLELIVDYGNSNKDMLKRMLEISSMKQQQNVEKQVNVVKNEKTESSAVPNDYMNIIYLIDDNNDTIFNLTGATKKFIDNINRNEYVVGAKTQSSTYPNRYDVAYRRKKQ